MPIPFFRLRLFDSDAPQLQHILALNERGILDFQRFSFSSCNLESGIRLAIRCRSYRGRFRFRYGDLLLLFGLDGLEFIVCRLAQLLLLYFAVDCPHVGFLEGKIAHVDVDHLSAIDRELFGQSGIDIS